MANKDEFEVVREANIAAPPAKVYGLLADFHRWPEWSPWEKLDPDMQRTHSGAPSGVGAIYEWEGNRKAGKGRMEITAAQPSSRVVLALQFLKPFKSNNTTTFDLTERDGGTHVKWQMVGPKTFLTRVMGIFSSMDKMVGGDFEKGLVNLGNAAKT
jgi:uncharacterized protein YndB with AHSA1/START domain